MSTSVLAADRDRDLATRLCAGDHDAFRALHALHHPALLALLVARAGNRHDAEEIAQDAWLRAWKARSSFDGRNFRAWVFEIAKNRLTDLRRRRREIIGMEGLDRQCEPDGKQDDRLAAFEECLENVGGEFAAVVRARLDGEKTAQIARRLGIEPDTVYTRMHRAKEQLHDCMKQKLA